VRGDQRAAAEAQPAAAAFQAAAAVLGAFLAAGCASSAPYTAQAAAIDTGLALGVSAMERAAGGCYAVCTNGTVCNPRTGWCEKGEVPAPGANEVCQQEPGGGLRCLPLDVSSISREETPAGRPPSPVGAVGISPATGRAPPPPAEASPAPAATRP
jgi:hypothetical protein